MVTGGELYLLAVTVLALVALAVAVPVLLDIAREGRERLRAGGPTRPADDADSDGADGVRCPHCETENEPGYAYCEECSRAL
ncbi:hypothetical protein NDI56_11745 [Haloarcula sp. S1CR25-12]|uniref:DUF7577 domain-containing protein n=1 Tax=Haloarcula saliterrae TaxID=2950534 RepID=A0ABU2FCT0_9EURY|nr:hypothetical protein [Haloarcula sp. S1CR25-12]MDS0260067.1 hypothetical protein [Haloarcula sp. S1CR25-12]